MKELYEDKFDQILEFIYSAAKEKLEIAILCQSFGFY